MYDCIIIGTGAAGVSSALTLKALKVNFLWLGNPDLSLKIRKAEQINNYPGLPTVSGEEMSATFLRQIKEQGITITEGKANGVYQTDGGFTVLCGQDSYEAKTVILAMGVETFKPVAGETEFLGRGVSYCAVCDGFLYKDKVIAVYAESAEELEEVKLLAKYARHIYLFTPVECEDLAANVILTGKLIRQIKGDMRVRAIVHVGGELEVDGVFMLKQSQSAQTLVHGLKTEGGHVVVDRACATSVAGIFAGGDCTGRPYQYAKAVGEGNVCAYSANSFLKDGKNKKNT